MAAITSIPAEGVIIAQPFDEESATPKHPVGFEVACADGCVYQYAQADEALTGQSYVVWRGTAAGKWSMITATLAATGGIGGVVATNSAVTDEYYFWVCVAKPASASPGLGIRTDAGVAADIVLKASSTTGQLVAGTLTEAVRLINVGLTAATPTTAAATNTNCWFRYFTRVGF